MEGRPLGSGDQIMTALRRLDSETLLAVGLNTFRNRRIATEKGNQPLAALHGVVSVLVDRALLERAAQQDTAQAQQ
jgi:hypothetical protein